MRLRNRSVCLMLACFSLGCATRPQEAMSQERMEELVANASNEAEGRPGAMQFLFDGVQMLCLSDVEHDRMRIIAPITTREGLAAPYLDLMLLANYHTSLDARYAVSDGVVYAAFLHPLSTLTESDLASAMRQVASLAQTFGSTYSSGELSFGVSEEREL